jgi:hypothetical protein
MIEKGWTRSTACSSDGCVEVVRVGNAVSVRSSEDEERQINFTPAEWRDFVYGVKRGEFDT